METYLSVLLIIVSSFFGFLVKTKVDSKCCCCTLQLSRNSDTNRLESISVVKKSKDNKNNVSDRNINRNITDIGNL